MCENNAYYTNSYFENIYFKNTKKIEYKFNHKYFLSCKRDVLINYLCNKYLEIYNN